MMTTLNGRLDDPGAWVTGIPDDLYAEIDRVYESFDTILVGPDDGAGDGRVLAGRGDGEAGRRSAAAWPAR